MIIIECPTNHNSRCRYADGFHCNDCGEFFDEDSPTYRSGELLMSIYMVLHNISADIRRNNKEPDEVLQGMMDKIGIGIEHENYEDLITEAEVIMERYNKNSNSSSVRIF